jgi:hypothetical protein
MRNRDSRYTLLFEEWVTEGPFIISQGEVGPGEINSLRVVCSHSTPAQVEGGGVCDNEETSSASTSPADWCGIAV